VRGRPRGGGRPAWVFYASAGPFHAVARHGCVTRPPGFFVLSPGPGVFMRPPGFFMLSPGPGVLRVRRAFSCCRPARVCYASAGFFSCCRPVRVPYASAGPFHAVARHGCVYASAGLFRTVARPGCVTRPPGRGGSVCERGRGRAVCVGPRCARRAVPTAGWLLGRQLRPRRRGGPSPRVKSVHYPRSVGTACGLPADAGFRWALSAPGGVRELSFWAASWPSPRGAPGSALGGGGTPLTLTVSTTGRGRSGEQKETGLPLPSPNPDMGGPAPALGAAFARGCIWPSRRGRVCRRGTAPLGGFRATLLVGLAGTCPPAAMRVRRSLWGSRPRKC